MRPDERKFFRVRGGTPQRLGDALGQTAKRSPEGRVALEAAVRRAWTAAVGEQIAANVKVKALRGSVLYVTADDEVWRHQIRFLSNSIKEKINEVVPRARISEIVASTYKNNYPKT